MTPEAQLTRAVLMATRHLVDWMRNNVGIADHNPKCPHCNQRKHPDKPPRMTAYGVPGKGGSDWIGIRRSDGRFVAMELKAPGKKPRPEQEQFIRRAQRSGALAFWADSVQAVLEAIK